MLREAFFSDSDHTTLRELVLLVITAVIFGLSFLALIRPAYGGSDAIIDSVPVGDRPLGMAVDSVHNKIYVSNESDHNVMVVDGNTHSVTKTISVEMGPRGVAVNASTNKVYVTNQSSNTVSVIDSVTDTLLGSVPTGAFPFWAAINEDANLVYVSNANSDDVSVIDGTTDTVIATVPVGDSPMRLGVYETTGKVYVPNRNDATVSIIDPLSNTVTAVVPVLDYPSVVKFDESSSRGFVGSANTAELDIINTLTEQVIDSVTFPEETSEIEIHHDTDKLYVKQTGQLLSDFRGLLVLDLTTFAQLDTIPNIDSAIGPTVLDTNFVTSRMYGVCHNEDELYVYTTPGIDDDGDGLLNDWETNGLDLNSDGVIDLDLPAMGADPMHIDIFVEIDYMVQPMVCWPLNCQPGHSHRPKPDGIERIVEAFDDAPVTNPDGSTGIRLHVDFGPDTIMNPVTSQTWGGLSESEELTHDSELGDITNVGGVNMYDWTEFDQIKQNHFSAEREPVFHYVVFAHDLGDLGGMSGIARGIPSSDCIVSLGSWTDSVGTVGEQAGTFMHELGHNLGLRHGGDDDERYKANYLSVMNYSFQTRGLRINGVDGNFDYSRFDLPDLDENNLNETVGLSGGPTIANYGTRFRNCAFADRIVNNANHPIDWNGNGNATDNPIAAETNRQCGLSCGCVTTILDSYSDWDHLVFSGGAIGAAGLEESLPRETVVEEITRDEDDTLIRELGVAVIGSATYLVSPGELVTHTFVISNTGEIADEYVLSITDSDGWADLSAIPPAVQVGPSEDLTIEVPLRVPPSAADGDSETLTLSAASTINAELTDTATLITTVSSSSSNTWGIAPAAASPRGGTVTSNSNDLNYLALLVPFTSILFLRRLWRRRSRSD
jgi:YVTN family beta-propeller protein